MARLITIHSWVFIVLMGIAETWVLVTTDKYWPLSLDDYAGIAVLIFASICIPIERRYLWLTVVYAVLAGNIYAMLFTRLDPIYGSGERIGGLMFILAYLSIGLALSLYSHHKQIELKKAV